MPDCNHPPATEWIFIGVQYLPPDLETGEVAEWWAMMNCPICQTTKSTPIPDAVGRLLTVPEE